MKRGDVVIVNLEPIRGSEQGGKRPCLIVQNDIGNKFSPTTIVAAITSKIFSKGFPTNVELSTKESRLEKNSTIMLNQIRTIDKGRILRKVSSLNEAIMKKVDLALRASLSLKD